ncbi:TonB-dependent receptor [Pedobacter sp. P351]|uniref:TonB-dependent receptor n=1 Tax=Pedobacter superstes TaxID=3133441 RepID=UPI0030AB4908
MKLTLVLIALTFMQIRAATFAQNVSVSAKNAPLKQVLAQIRKQTGYDFLYNNISFKQLPSVSIEVKNQDLLEVLDNIFQGQPVRYVINNKTILISKKPEIATNVREDVTITGIVTDEKAEPLPGVTVKLKGSFLNAVTDNNGKFSLKISEPKGVLVFSFIGFMTLEYPISNQRNINIVLKESVSDLSEVVVVGYGTVKRSDLTGSVVSVKQSQITSTPVTNVLETLQGKVAGMDLTRSSGETGAGMNFTIRGNRSLNASNSPLVIVDGIQYGSYIDINPNDIESIEVLKDASSTAIYGSRGANGIILITTKAGKNGKTKVEFNNYYGLNTLSDYPYASNTSQYVAITREAHRALAENTNKPVPGDATIFGAKLDNINKGIDTDWADILLHDGSVWSNHIAVSAGNEKTRFRLSSEYFKEKGLLKHDELNRFVQHLNLDHQITKALKIGTILNFNSSKQERRNTSFWTVSKALPIGLPYNEDGSINKYPWPANLDINPLMDESTDNYSNNTTSSRVFMVGFAEWNVLKKLSFRSNFGVDLNNSQQGIFEGNNTSLAGGNGGFSRSLINDNKGRSWTWENVMNYNFDLKKHALNLMLGNSMISNRSVSFGGEGKDQPYSTALFYNLGANARDVVTRSNLVESSLNSFFGRLNYKFNDKYLLTASLRADGASVLAEGNKWAYFPSVALAWRIKQESFLSGFEALSDLKFRTSYGISGNSAIQPYQTNGGLNRIAFSFDETAAFGYLPKQVANKELGWEKTATLNGGLDFGFFNNRLTGSVDIYKTKTNDLLMERILPSLTGFNSIIANVGKTETNGIDVVLSGTIMSRKSFSWSTDVNFATFKEKIVALSVGGNDVSKGWFVGSPINILYDYEKTGIWQTSEKADAAKFGKVPGEIKVRDQNNDGKITATDDRIILGQRSPEWTAGMTNNFGYKNFALSVLIYARVGQMINSDYLGSYYTGGIFNTSQVDYWTPENPTNAYPRPWVGHDDQYLSTLRYIDGSFLKIKDVRLSYKLPKTMFSKFPVNGQLYLTAKNYFTFSKMDNYDPERGGSADFPLTRQLVFGINLGL